MTRTYPLPNGSLLMLHLGTKGEDYIGPNYGYRREAEGEGWAVDVNDMVSKAPEPVKEETKPVQPKVETPKPAAQQTMTRPPIKGK